MTTRKDLEQLLGFINAEAQRLGLRPFALDFGPQGRVRVVDSTGRGILGVSTGLGMASSTKRDMQWRMEGFLAALEQMTTLTQGAQA